MNIALLHALPLDGRMWEPQRPVLAGHDVHAPTLYDLGSSFDEWALGVLEQVPGKLVAVGASMGGYIAARDRAARPRAARRARARRLAGGPRRARAAPAAREEWIRIAREQGGEGLWEAAAKNFFTPQADPAVVARAHEIVVEQDPEGLVRRSRRSATAPTRPTAVTSGDPAARSSPARERPLIPPEVARELAAASPNGRRGGHRRVRPSPGHGAAGRVQPDPDRVSRRAVTDLPSVVDAAWVEAHLGEPGLLLGDVRGPNAHTRRPHPGLDPARARLAAARHRSRGARRSSRRRSGCGCAATG